MSRGGQISTALLSALALGCAALAAGSAASELPDPERECAEVRVPYGERGTTQYILISEIRTEMVGCSEARALGRDYAHRSHFRRHGAGHHGVANKWPGSVANFGCLSERLGTDVRSVTCREDPRALSFAWHDSSPYH